jgi:mxaJ protein
VPAAGGRVESGVGAAPATHLGSLLRQPLSRRAERLLLGLPLVALVLFGLPAATRSIAPPAGAAVVPDPRLHPPAVGGHPPGTRILRVCSDPNNLPFSDRSGRGFENAIAEVLAQELNATVQYTWWAQRRGFVRNTLNAGSCDVIIGVPRGFEPVLTTRPYYRSAYAFVARRSVGADRPIRSFDDPRLRDLRIGVQLVGDDYANTPPAAALARRGIVRNVRGYTVYGDYREPAPPARIVHAVAQGEVDVAVVWGPLAGYFARRARPRLEVVPVSAQVDAPGIPLAFDIAVGVRRRDRALRDTLDRILARRRQSVDSILDAYAIPRVRALARVAKGE